MSQDLRYTAAVRRDGFVFNGHEFYTDGDYRRYARAGSARLEYLLTHTSPPPVFTKKGTLAKRQPIPPKDEPAAFYTAQMIHYGLKPLKTRDPAKKKLLSALEAGGGQLTVPQHILDLEAALRKEWQEADEERKRRLDTAAEEQAKERQKLRELQPRTKTTAKRTFRDHVHLSSEDESDCEEIPEQKRRKHSDHGDPMRTQIQELSGEEARNALFKILDSGSSGRAMVTAALNIGNKHHAVEGKEYKSDGAPLTAPDWAGVYIVKSKELADNWSEADRDLKFQVYPSSTGAHLWASFDFAVITGVMRSIGRPPSVAGEDVRIEWRGRETGENEMTLSKYNCGVLRFYGNGIIQAHIGGGPCGNFFFSGSFNRRVLEKNAAQQKADVKQWKQKWRGFNSYNYDVERTARWGRWTGEEEDDSPFESDTTAGHHQREEEPDFDELSNEDSNDEAY